MGNECSPKLVAAQESGNGKRECGDGLERHRLVRMGDYCGQEEAQGEGNSRQLAGVILVRMR